MKTTKGNTSANLNENEKTVLIACVNQVIDCTATDFGYTDYIKIPGFSKNQVKGYLSDLQKKDLIHIAQDEDFAGQYCMTLTGLAAAGYDENYNKIETKESTAMKTTKKIEKPIEKKQAIQNKKALEAVLKVENITEDEVIEVKKEIAKIEAKQVKKAPAKVVEAKKEEVKQEKPKCVTHIVTDLLLAGGTFNEIFEEAKKLSEKAGHNGFTSRGKLTAHITYLIKKGFNLKHDVKTGKITYKK